MERKIEKVDWILIGSFFLLLTFGVLLIYSATESENTLYWQKQIGYIVVGMGILVSMIFIPTRFFYLFGYLIYGLSLIPLIYVGFIKQGTGVERWILLPMNFKFQPSEFAKFALLLALARFLAYSKPTLRDIKTLLMPGFLFIIPFVLVLKQPDLSTALVFGAMILFMLYWAGMEGWELFILVSPIASILLTSYQLAWGVFFGVLFIVMWMNRVHIVMLLTALFVNMAAGYASLYIWNSVLKDHQRSRILTFVNPMRDPKGEGYQIIQSKVATGSGGLFGKGFNQGTQVKGDFLPEEHTDFIFSVLGEQFGFVGCGAVLLLFFILVARIFYQCSHIKNRFSNLIVVGVGAIFSFHISVNVAMTVGLMPVTGLPLPFLSYGGTFLITCTILLGLVLNVRTRNESF